MKSPSGSLQVLVVGAGPTGLTAALELSRCGVQVRIVDRRPEPSETSRAVAVQARTLELLEQRGVGDALVRAGNPVQRTVLHRRGRPVGTVELSRIPSRFDYVLLVSQAATEDLLSRMLRRQDLAVERGVELLAAEQNGSGVHARLRHPDGREERVECAYVIDASGAHSTLRRALDLPFSGRELPQSYRLADVRLQAELPIDQMSIFLSSEGFLAAFPMAEGRVRLMATDPERQRLGDTARGMSSAPPELAEMQQAWDAVAGMPGRIEELAWSSRFHVDSRHLATLRSGRIFFAGDAAHVHSPAGGQGMNTGIQDAINLSWKLGLVLRGRAGDQLLDTYGAERLPVIERLVWRTERATRIFNSTSGWTLRLVSWAARLMLRRAGVQERAVRAISQTAVDYRGSGLTSPPSGVAGLRSGDRVPDLAVIARQEGEAALLSDLVDLRQPTLISTGAGPQSGWGELIRPWRGVINTQQATVVAASPGLAPEVRALADALRAAPTLLLIRPDGYLAAAAPLEAPAPVIAWLEQWLLPASELGATAPSPAGSVSDTDAEPKEEAA